MYFNSEMLNQYLTIKIKKIKRVNYLINKQIAVRVDR